jgi:5-methylcytosine-specific restriction enzyme A
MGQSNFKPRHQTTSGRSFNGRKKIDNLYDHNWEKYRLKFLAVNPECYACGKRAEVVDHLIPHQGCEKLFQKTDNHLPLCTPCHNLATNLFDKKYRAGNPVTDKIKWLNEKRVSFSLHPRRVKVLATYP